MQLSSITFDGEKKNSSRFIIPASYFRAKGIKPIPVTLPKETVKQPEKILEPVSKIEKVIASFQVQEPLPVIDLKSDTQRTSGLSLKSIQAKKEHQIKQMEVVIDPNDLPKEAFTEDDFFKAWNNYIQSLDAKGEKIMASMLAMNTPKLD